MSLQLTFVGASCGVEGDDLRAVSHIGEGVNWCLGLRGVLGVCPPLGAAVCRDNVRYPVFAPGT